MHILVFFHCRKTCTARSGYDWCRRDWSEALMPPFEHHWLACIRARRDGKIPATLHGHTFCSVLRDSGIFLANRFIFASRLTVGGSPKSHFPERDLFFLPVLPSPDHLRHGLWCFLFKSTSGHSAHKAVFHVVTTFQNECK